MKVEMDYAGWEKEFTGNVNIVVKADQKTIDEACQILYQRIVDRTPVGNPRLWSTPYWPKNYKPGFLKSNWRIIKIGKDVIISNDAPYAYSVENGWSKQAPTGMMRISLLEFQKILEEVQRRNRK